MAGLSDEQRYYLKFMCKYMNYDSNDIRNHPSMINKDTGKPFQKRAITNWITRLNDTGDVKKLSKTGRPKILNQQEEDLLVKTIQKFPKLRYRKIRSLGGFQKVGVRAVNQYAIRNNFSKINK